MLDAVVAEAAIAELDRARHRIDGIHLAPIMAMVDGQPLLDLSHLTGDASTVAVASMGSVTAADVGRQACVAFAGGDPGAPVMLGVLATTALGGASAAGVVADRLELRAARELVLRCGDAILRMTADGNVRLRATNIATHARATNRIRGGAVEIN